jgi:hypothetical protein
MVSLLRLGRVHTLCAATQDRSQETSALICDRAPAWCSGSSLATGAQIVAGESRGAGSTELQISWAGGAGQGRAWRRRSRPLGARPHGQRRRPVRDHNARQRGALPPLARRRSRYLRSPRHTQYVDRSRSGASASARAPARPASLAPLTLALRRLTFNLLASMVPSIGVMIIDTSRLSTVSRSRLTTVHTLSLATRAPVDAAARL